MIQNFVRADGRFFAAFSFAYFFFLGYPQSAVVARRKKPCFLRPALSCGGRNLYSPYDRFELAAKVAVRCFNR